MTIAASVSPPAGIGSPWNGPAGTCVTFEAREAQNAAEREERRGERPPYPGIRADVGGVDEECGRDAEADGVREAVELFAEVAAAAEAARDAAVHHVEEYGEAYKRCGGKELAVRRKYD